ncbi:uncharacterized protein METZ01_LOCUS343358, partial [marine metagenome]
VPVATFIGELLYIIELTNYVFKKFFKIF